jgi:D-glycero-alpha-D-manno-heptose-7-phosphate kinase
MRSNQQRPRKSIRARAPIRVCDNGGWTDTWFAKYGTIFNIAVSPYACVEIDVYTRHERAYAVEIFAENYGERFVHSPGWSHHPMLEAAVSMTALPDDVALDIRLHCDAPAGAGTGTSAAVIVAMLCALDAIRAPHMTAYDLAMAAHAVETRMLKRQCGIQDQLAAAFGGVCFIDMFDYPNASVSRLSLPEALSLELEHRLMLVFLGKAHNSSDVHEKVIHELEDAGPGDRRIAALRRTAERSRDALLSGDLRALGAAMIQNTDAQAGLNPALVGADAARVIDIARRHGALGWKVNGAGGDGGSITLLGDGRGEAQRAMLRAISAAGAYTPIPIRLSHEGARAWTIGGE